MKIISLGIFVIMTFLLLTGCGKEEKTEEAAKEPQSELIREEGTDVASLDINGDGTVYQCPMHYQVIADAVETCPLCKMDLEAYSLADAEKNLESHYHQ